MKIAFVRSDAVGLLELVRFTRERLHGAKSVSDFTFKKTPEGQSIPLRNGKPLNASTETKQLEAVHRAICNALRKGDFEGFVDASTDGTEHRIPAGYWSDDISSTAWRTLLTGKLEDGSTRSLHRQPVYFSIDDVEKFVTGLPGEGSPKIPTSRTARRISERKAIGKASITKKRPPLKVVEAWAVRYYKALIDEGRRSTREEDEAAFNKEFENAPREIARQLRNKFAPKEWLRPGPHKAKR